MIFEVDAETGADMSGIVAELAKPFELDEFRGKESYEMLPKPAVVVKEKKVATSSENKENKGDSDEFFVIPQGLSAEEYVELTEEVLECAMLLFAPLGAARTFEDDDVAGDLSSGSGGAGGSNRSAATLEVLREPWQRVLDAVAEATYRNRGLSEGTVALSTHTLLEEQREPRSVAVIQRTAGALGSLVEPPRILLLPPAAAAHLPPFRSPPLPHAAAPGSEGGGTTASASGDSSHNGDSGEAARGKVLVVSIVDKVAAACRLLTQPQEAATQDSPQVEESPVLATEKDINDGGGGGGGGGNDGDDSDSGGDGNADDSRGWGGTYLGTVLSLGYHIGASSSNERQEATKTTKTKKGSMTVPVLLGQKAKLRACVAALAEVRKDSLRALSSGGGGGGNAGGGGGGCGSGEEKEDVLGKKNQEGNGDSGGGDGEGGSGGGEEDEWVASAAKGQPLLQALAEVAWDLGREDDGEKKMKEKEGTVAVLAASFSEASAWSLAHACFAASSTAWQHTTRTPSSWDSGSDAAARGESARCALEAKASLQRALEAGEVAAAQEAVCSSSVALSFAWGTTLPLHAVAELLCLRAQAKLACAEAQDNAAQAQREASAGWFGGSRAAVTAEQHALASQASRQSAQVDVKRAKQLSPQCLGVLRWEAELELRACVQGMEELSEELSAVSSAEMSASSSTSSSSSASMAGGGGGGGVGACGDGAAGDKEDGVDALLLAELAARASEAVLRLAKAFVLDGSRDTALAQALEEGAKAATKMQAGVAFKAQMRTLNGDFGTESSSSSRSSSGSGGGGSIGTTNSPPPLPPPPAWAPPPKLQPPPPPKLLPPLPAPWMVQSFFSGFVEAVPPLPPPPPPLLLLLPQKARQRFLSALPRKAAAKLVASVVLAKEGGQGSGSGSGSGGSVGGGGGSLGKDINDIDETEGGERDDGGDGSGGVNGGGDDGADDSLPILLFLNDPLQSWRQRRGRRSNEPTTTTAMATAPATTEANDEEENDDAADAECFSLEAAAAVEEAAACLPSAYSRRLHALVAGSQRAKVAGDFGRASELAGEAAKVGWARHRCHLGGSGGAAAAAQSWRKKKAEEEDKVEASTASSAASAAASAEVAAFLKELETDLEVALTCWALEQDGSFAHLRCAFEAAEESFTRALQLLKCTTPLPTSDDDEDDAEADAEHDDAADEEGDKEEEGGGEDHDEERSADVDVASAAGSGDSPPLNHPAAGGDENGSSGKACSPAAPSGEDAYAAVLGKAAKRWARSMGSGPVARWRQSALLRCQVKLACSRTDGTEAQKISADQAFQAALDTAESLGVGEPRALHRRLGQAEKQGLADSADAERFCPTSSENMGVLEEAEEKAQSVDQSLKKRQQQRGQEKAGRDRRWGVAAAGAAGVGAFLQRGQLRLMDNELDGSLEDLKKGKSLVEALLSWTAQDQRGDQQEKQEATASAAEASRQDSSGWDGLRSTLHRLEAALCGSLGVALFKVELMRNGGAVLMGGGMPYEMARVLRVTEAKHPNQGEFLLLHGDLLAQCGDFKAALAKFKKAADACTPPPPPLAVEAASAEGAAAAAAAEEVGAAAAANQTTPPPPPPSLPPPPPPPPPPPTALPLNCPLPWVNAGRCYLQMNEGQLAERHLLMGLELDPKCSSAHLDLGQLKLQGGDLEAALTHFSDARKNSRSFPELHDAMACELVARHHQTALDELNGK